MLEKDFNDWHKRKNKIHKFATRKFPKRGQVWVCDLGKNIACEQDGIRPCIVLNTPPRGENTSVVVPASRTLRKSSFRSKKFNFLLHQIRAIDNKRLLRIIDKINKKDTDNLCERLLVFLGK